MTKLVLGVVDIPYSEPAGPAKKVAKGRRRKPVKPKKPQPVVTTGFVAEVLEEKYGVMRIFFDAHKDDIAKDLEGGVAEAFEAMLQGAPASLDAFGAATQKIQERFRDFLTNKEIDGLAPGVPTQASLLGISHRFKGKKGSPRPSFIDTGQYEATQRTWVED